MMAEITKSSLWGEKREKQEPKDLNPLKIWSFSCYCSVAKSCPTLRPHELQHTRLPCPSLSPGVCSNSCPLSQWCHPAMSFSVTCFSSCPQSLPASRSFPMSQLFASDGQSIGASASASVLLMNTQGWFPLGWTGLIWAFTHAFLLPATLPASSFSLAHLTEASGFRQHFFLTEALTKLDSVLKSKNMTLLAKVCIVKALVFPIVVQRCQIWTIKKA